MPPPLDAVAGVAVVEGEAAVEAEVVVGEEDAVADVKLRHFIGVLGTAHH